MAVTLTESEKLKIAEILGVNYIEVNDQIFNLGEACITPTVEAGVRADIARWNAGVGADFVIIESSPANFGASINPEREKNDIRKSIANKLYLQGYGIGGGTRLVRG